MYFSNKFISLNFNNLIYKPNIQYITISTIEKLNEKPNLYYHFVRNPFMNIRQLRTPILLIKKKLWQCSEPSLQTSQKQKDKKQNFSFYLMHQNTEK